MVLVGELAVGVALFLSFIIGSNAHRMKIFEPCKTNCANKPYAVDGFKMGKETPSLGRFER